MTVATTNVSKVYLGNGSVTSFAIDFQFWDEEEIEIWLRTTADGTLDQQSLTTDYSITGGDGLQGTVEMVVAPPGTKTLHILRVSNSTQEVDLTPATDFPTATVEQVLDRQALRIQEATHAGEVRSMQAPLTDMDTLGDFPDMTLPDKATRAGPGTYLGFDADGEPVIISGTIPATVPTTPYGESLLVLADAADLRDEADIVENAGAMDRLQAGVITARPAPVTFGKGFWWATDELRLHYSSGSGSWMSVTVAQLTQSQLPAASLLGRLFLDVENHELLRDNSTALVPIQSPWPRGSIGGLAFAPGGLASITVQPGEARAHIGNSTPWLGRNLKLTSSITKSLGAANSWVVGTGLGMAKSVSQAINDWYYIFLIGTDTGLVDVAFDTNIDGTNILSAGSNAIQTAGYDRHIRYIGMFRTNAVGSGEIVDFFLEEDHTLWVDPFIAFADAPGGRDYRSGFTVTLNGGAPNRLNDITWTTEAYGTAGSELIITTTDQNPAAPSQTVAPGSMAHAVTDPAGRLWIRPDLGSDIWIRTAAEPLNEFNIFCHGFIDSRGRNM